MHVVYENVFVLFPKMHSYRAIPSSCNLYENYMNFTLFASFLYVLSDVVYLQYTVFKAWLTAQAHVARCSGNPCLAYLSMLVANVVHTPS